MSDGQSVAAGTKGQRGGYGATKLARLLLAALMTACGSSSPPVGVDGAPLPPDLDASVVPPGPGQDADPMNPPSPWDAALGDTGGVVLAARRAQMLSVPPSFVLSNEEYSYMPKHSGAGDTEWRIVQAPPGLLVRERRLIAEANTLPAGAHTVVLEGQVGDTLVRQSYPLTVATPLQRAARLVTPTEPTQVVVQSETSLVRRAGVSLPVGAVSVDTNVSVNEVSRAPQRVGYRGAGPVVDFGPSGTVFRRRATVALPFDGQMNPEKTGAFTYNPHAGRWEPVEVLGVDVENKLVFAKASHFSMYMAAEGSLSVATSLGVMPAPPRCEGRLSAHSVLEATTADLPVAAINNLSDEMKALVPGALEMNAEGMPVKTVSLADLLATGQFRGTLRVVYVYELHEGDDDARVLLDRKVMTASLFVNEEGVARVTVVDALGNVIEARTYPALAGNEGEVWKRLSGATAHALFTDVPREGLSVGTRVHLIYFPDDRSTEPTAIDDLGMSLVQTYPAPGSTPSARAATFDEDCDQLLGTFDAEDGRQKPAIVAEPLELVSTLVGQAVKLSATVVNADGMPKAQWNAGEASLADAPDEPQARIFSAGKPGRYVVVFNAEVGGDTLSQSFAIDVAAPPIVNTPPACRPFASAGSGLVGETVGLKAVVADRETPLEALTVHWGLLDPGADPGSAADDTLVDSGLVSGSGEAGRLVLGREGKYVVACRAFDGKEWGLPGSVEVAALPVNVNRPPEDAFLSPPVADILLGDSVRLVMRARDPEGEPLTFSFTSLPEQDGQGAPLVPDPTSTADRSEIVIKPTEAGLIEVRATASDGEFTTPPEYARIIVREKAPSRIDTDGDGFSAGMGPGEDCNDANRAINPDAVEICGNDIDENCDGRIARGDCDGDGYAACDGSNTGSCDCDDTDRYVFSDARELCNGRDDNCDGKIDESFNLEGSCTVGIGVCQASAKLVCSPDGYRTLCSGTPAPASPELCDARDNDCDAQVDEDDVCALPLIGIYFECAKPRATDDPTKFTDCQQLDMEGFELRKDGVVVLLSAPKGVLNYDPKAAPYCWHNEGTWQMKSANTLVARLPNPDTGAIEEHLLENVTRKADRLSFSMFDEETRMTRVQEHRLVSANNGGKCNFPTGCRPNPEVCNRQDDDCDGQADNGLTCTFCDADKVDNDKNGKVDEPGEPCAPPPACDKDQVDNDKNGKVDEPGEPCGPPMTCDKDQVDNDKNGKVDEPGEPCAPPLPCNKDGFDNDRDGIVDEADEPCGPPVFSCDKDQIDNDNNGKVDEPGEPCAPPLPCNKDGFDNDRDGTIDEADEPCGPPVSSCDKDQVDNDNNGKVDEPGEPCAPPLPCYKDGFDNDRDGIVDEADEPCGPPVSSCDKDQIDNDNNGKVDEPGEPCAPPLPCYKDGIDNDRDGIVDEADEPCGPPVSSCDKDQIDNDQNGKVDEPGEPCAPPLPCNKDGFDNDRDGIVDEADEPCGPPVSSCDKDQIDNDHNGKVDEPGEPCAPPLPCYKDGIDNDRDGIVDEADEPCSPPVSSCDKDQIDNDQNGKVDEPGEPCGPPLTSCDKDQIDNDHNGKVDEPGEPCAPPLPCYKDGIDNDRDGIVDEADEPCGPPVSSCETDRIDNDNNGKVDEPGEPCGPPLTSCDKDQIDNDKNGKVDEPGEPCAPLVSSCEADQIDNDKNGKIDEPGEPCAPLPV